MKKSILFFILLIATVLMGCSKSDAEKIEGFALVYMPQASTAEYYAVPTGAGEHSYNFKIEADELLVFLGVMRSGLGEYDSFSVDVMADDSKSAETLPKISNGVLLPASQFTIPTNASVASGDNSATFYMKVKKSVINEAANAGKVLIATVRIDNPTRYTLAQTNTSTTILIDVNAIKAHL